MWPVVLLKHHDPVRFLRFLLLYILHNKEENSTKSLIYSNTEFNMNSLSLCCHLLPVHHFLRVYHDLRHGGAAASEVWEYTQASGWGRLCFKFYMNNEKVASIWPPSFLPSLSLWMGSWTGCNVKTPQFCWWTLSTRGGRPPPGGELDQVWLADQVNPNV